MRNHANCLQPPFLYSAIHKFSTRSEPTRKTPFPSTSIPNSASALATAAPPAARPARLRRRSAAVLASSCSRTRPHIVLFPPLLEVWSGKPSGLGLSSPSAGKDRRTLLFAVIPSLEMLLCPMDADSVQFVAASGLFAWRSASGRLLAYLSKISEGFRFSRTRMPDVKFARDQLSRDWTSCVALKGI